MRPFHSIKQVSDQTGIAPQTIWKYIQDGRLQAYKFNNTAWRIADSELQRFIKDALFVVGAK